MLSSSTISDTTAEGSNAVSELSLSVGIQWLGVRSENKNRSSTLDCFGIQQVNVVSVSVWPEELPNT